MEFEASCNFITNTSQCLLFSLINASKKTIQRQFWESINVDFRTNVDQSNVESF